MEAWPYMNQTNSFNPMKTSTPTKQVQNKQIQAHRQPLTPTCVGSGGRVGGCNGWKADRLSWAGVGYRRSGCCARMFLGIAQELFTGHTHHGVLPLWA
eukprot:scaffold152019_cov14-Tisochrysis_lutea.AAC.1